MPSVVHSNVYILMVPVMEIHGHRRTYIASGPRLIVPERSVKTCVLILSFFLTKLDKSSNKIMIVTLNLELSALPIHSTLYLCCYSIDVEYCI